MTLTHTNNYPTKYRCCLRNVQSGTMLNVHVDTVTGWEEAGALNFTNGWQVWRLREVSPGSSELLIYNEAAKKCIYKQGTHDFVGLTDDFGRRDAHWTMVSRGNNVWEFHNVADSNIVLDLAAGLGHNGCHVHGWPSHGGGNQGWTMYQQ